MATRAATNKDAILTTAQLAAELAITEAEALALMHSDGFPATHIPGTKEGYCIDRSLLERWIKANAREVEGITSPTLDELFNFGESRKK